MAKPSKEVERKWLVIDPPALSKYERVKIVQGYLSGTESGTEVRLRREDKKYFETFKIGTGLERDEMEVELSKKQFKILWPATRSRRLAKSRYKISYKGKKIELDIYHRNLHGLKVAEVEFSSREQATLFSPPPWFGKEITGQRKYKNSTLAAKDSKDRAESLAHTPEVTK